MILGSDQTTYMEPWWEAQDQIMGRIQRRPTSDAGRKSKLFRGLY